MLKSCRDVTSLLVILMIVSCSENPLLDVVSERVLVANRTGTVASPVPDKSPGLYYGDTSISLSSATPDARIYYTLDGSTPTDSTDEYTGPIPIRGDGSTVTIKSMAAKNGWAVSPMSTATYTIQYSSGTPSASALLSDTTPSFDWDDAAAATAYRFQLSSTIDFSSTLADVDNLTASAYTHASILPNEQRYWWRAAAFQNNAWSDFSEAREFTMAFGRITIISPADGSNITNPRPTLEWDDVEGAVEYEIQVDSNIDFSNASTNAAFGSTYTIATDIDEEVEGGEHYADQVRYWRVRSKSEDGHTWGAWMDGVMLTLKFYSVGDTGPAGGTVFYDRYNTEGLAWADNGWRYMETVPDQERASYAWSLNTSTIFTDTSLLIGTGYENTLIIATNMSTSENNAFNYCLNYQKNGYEDWHLPSATELSEMVFDQLPAGTYWSSSFENANGANAYYVDTADRNSIKIGYFLTSHYVRPTRRF